MKRNITFNSQIKQTGKYKGQCSYCGSSNKRQNGTKLWDEFANAKNKTHDGGAKEAPFDTKSCWKRRPKNDLSQRRCLTLKRCVGGGFYESKTPIRKTVLHERRKKKKLVFRAWIYKHSCEPQSYLDHIPCKILDSMLFYGIARRSSQPLLPAEFVRLTLGVFKPTLRYAQKILKRL